MVTPEGDRETPAQRANRLRVLLDVDWDLIGVAITDRATWPVRARAITDDDLAALRGMTAADLGLLRALQDAESEALDREFEAVTELAAEVAIAIKWGHTATQAAYAILRPDNEARIWELMRASNWDSSPPGGGFSPRPPR